MFDNREHNARHLRSGARHSRNIALTYGILVGFVGCLFLDVCTRTVSPSISTAFHELELFATPAFAGERHSQGGDTSEHEDFQQQNIDQQNQQDSDRENFQSENRDNASNSEDGSSWNGQSESSRNQSDDSEQSRYDRSDPTSKHDIDDESKPPKTLESLLKRLFKEKKNSEEQAKQDSLNRNDAKKNKKAPATHQTAEGFEEVVGQEILAVDVSPTAVARAKALGFKTVRAINLSKLEISLTRLVPPYGMDARAAQEILSQDLPAESFSINQKYRIYKTATGTAPDRLNASAAARDAGHSPCDADHCFGRDLIGWKGSSETCAARVRIGIIDTAVDLTHPAFSHKKLELRHLGPVDTPSPEWHGTGVTALLAGDSLSGTPGLIPDAQFAIADIFHADADGEPASDTFSMLRALNWLDAKRVNIINMSLSGPRDELVERAIQTLSAKGVLFVAAAGNEGPAAPPSYPAAYDNVIAVTAVSKDLRSYRYANRGAYIDIAAPGVSIWTALPGSKEGYHSGTSFATPYVTASLAAIYSQHPIRSKKAALNLMAFQDIGPPGRDTIYGEGLLLAPAACGGSNQIARSSPIADLGSSPERLPWSHPVRQ